MKEKDGVMWQCRECLDFFENTSDVEFWYNDQPYHRKCLVKKAKKEMVEPEPVIEEVKNPNNSSIEFDLGVLKVS
jgi:hypothetical protein